MTDSKFSVLDHDPINQTKKALLLSPPFAEEEAGVCLGIGYDLLHQEWKQQARTYGLY
jgi:hypothetical protein